MTTDLRALARAAVGAWENPHTTRAFLDERMEDLKAGLNAKPAVFDADEFMRGFNWAKWSDCRDMVEAAYEAGRKEQT